MPIHIGTSTKNQQQISIGDTQMQKVYVGDKLVWEKIGNPIIFIGHHSVYGLYQNPSVDNFTVSTDATILIVCIKNITTIRSSGAPTWNGVALTSVGDYYGTDRSEIWYMQNPDIGTYDLIIPNTSAANLHVSSSWYKSVNPITLHGFVRYNASSAFAGGDISIPSQKNLLLIDAVTYIYHFVQPRLHRVTNTDFQLFFGVGGAVGGSATQFKSYKSGSETSYYMGWEISNPTWPWFNIIAVFKT